MAEVISEYKIANVVVTARIDGRLDCAHIARRTPNCEYDPGRFAALKHRVRFQGSAPTFLVFESGKIVCVGSASVEMARAAVERFLRHLDSICILGALDAPVEVQNIVAHSNCGRAINLDTLVRDRWQHCHYEPELFPGLKCSVEAAGHAMVCNIFSTGKMVVTLSLIHI